MQPSAESNAWRACQACRPYERHAMCTLPIYETSLQRQFDAHVSTLHEAGIVRIRGRLKRICSHRLKAMHGELAKHVARTKDMQCARCPFMKRHCSVNSTRM